MTTQSFPNDAIAAVSHPDPYPYYERVVAERPFYYDAQLASWVASSAGAVAEVLTSDLCTVRPETEPVPKALIGSEAGEIFSQFIRMNDRADRRRVKVALAAALESFDGSRLIDRADTYARVLLRQGDLPPKFAFHLSAYTIADLLGIPGDLLPRVSQLTEDFVRAVAPGTPAQAAEQGIIAAARLSALFRELLTELDVAQSNSLLGSARRELSQAGCDDADITVANAIGFLFQAYDATAGLIGNSLVALSIRTDLRDVIAVDPGALRSFVAEVIRFDSPVQNTRRYVSRSGVIAGRDVQEGDAVLVVLAAANRDPSANASPDRFDINRNDRRAFTFGLGDHACPGEVFATTIAMQGVLAVMRSGIDLAPLIETARYRPSPNVRIPEFAHGIKTNAGTLTSA